MRHGSSQANINLRDVSSWVFLANYKGTTHGVHQHFHSHTHNYIFTPTHIHILTHILTLTHTLSHILIHTLTLSYSHTYIVIHTLKHILIHTFTYSLTLTHTHTHTLIHTNGSFFVSILSKTLKHMTIGLNILSMWTTSLPTVMHILLDVPKHVYKSVSNWIVVPLHYYDSAKLIRTWNE